MVLVISLLVSAILAVTIMLSWSSRIGVSEQTETDGKVIAQLLSRSAGILDKLPEDVEELIGQQMLVQAMFAAHMVALAEGPATSTNQLKQYLKDIVNKTNLDEITVTDSKGYAYLQTNPTPIPFVFKESMPDYPKESEFYPLLTGALEKYVQAGYVRDDQLRFKYAGVAGVDKPRIVQVGVNFRFLDEIRHRVGFKRLTESLLATGSVQAIWIVNNNLKTLAYGAKEDLADLSKTPSDMELDLLEKVVKSGSMYSIFHKGFLKVMAPVYGKENVITGATVIHLPTKFLEKTLDYQLKLSALVAVCVLGLGILLTYLMASSLTKPVTRITSAAAQIEKGSFDLHSMDDISRRYDEFGKLSQVFTGMAKEVLSREERLDAMVKLRTKELESQTKKLQSTLKELRSTQDQLVTKEKLASLGELSFGIAHELKNPLNFVINFSDVSAELAQELLKATEKDKLSPKDFAKMRELLQDLYDNSDRIKNHGKHAEIIINSMIKHSAIKSEEKATSFDFNKFVESNLKTFTKNLQQKQEEFDFAINFRPGKKIGKAEFIGPDISRVIGNILDNAHDAIYEKNSDSEIKNFKPAIEISTTSDSRSVYLSISDNGCGITPQNIKKIFNPLFTTKTSITGNTGMGLSLAYTIAVDRHNGDIKVESQIGKGTTFTIKLPRHHAEKGKEK